MIDANLFAALAAPFPPADVHFKPGVVQGNRALALAYLDARAVMDRLDEVLSPAGWQDEYTFLGDGSVVCTLRCRFGVGGEWITKTDVGGQSEQPDPGDRRKAAVSDAIKRAAIKVGIGRYLYRLPPVWADYDPQKKRFVRTPALPAWALPAASDPAELITDEQARELARLLAETRTDSGKFCAHYGIEDAQSLPAARFPEAVGALKRKMAPANN
jgi:hypothetical protein